MTPKHAIEKPTGHHAGLAAKLGVHWIETLDPLIQACCAHQGPVAIITDHHVRALHGEALTQSLQSAGMRPLLLSVPPGEGAKTRTQKIQLEDQLLNAGFGRDSLIIALGGGVVTDLAGFVAATFCRGIPVIYAPTTLLAMVDAAIGGKTGVNTPHGKNLIGSFQLPQAIYMHANYLSTLPQLEITSAFAEMLKHALIADASHWSWLQTQRDALRKAELSTLIQAIERSCAIKCRLIENDLRDQGQRALLNAGHTVGHAVESLCQGRLTHGQAVAIGLVVESHIATTMGHLDINIAQHITTVIASFGLPTRVPRGLSTQAILASMQHDKKNQSNSIQMVLPSGIGQCFKHGDTYTHAVEGTSIASLFKQLTSNEGILP